MIRRLALDRRSILNAVLIAKNTFKTGRQERGFICSVTRISVELLPTVPRVNLKVAVPISSSDELDQFFVILIFT